MLMRVNNRFPEDETLKATYTQFLLGPSLLITPVLIPNVDSVNGVFPGIGEGTRWYDWYTLQEVSAQPQENTTLSAPLEHINVHARGGTVFILQEPGYTTAETKNNSYSLLITLDDNDSATGTVYLDDGVSLEPQTTKIVTVSCKRSDENFQTLTKRSSPTAMDVSDHPLRARIKRSELFRILLLQGSSRSRMDIGWVMVVTSARAIARPWATALVS